MIGTIRKLIRYRVGQTVARKTARTLGFRALAGPIGVLAGFRALRKR